MVFEELDPKLNEIMWHDFDNPLRDSILDYLWNIYQV
jgi:hypothetical protein